jgi:hypothetical protein
VLVLSCAEHVLRDGRVRRDGASADRLPITIIRNRGSASEI